MSFPYLSDVFRAAFGVNLPLPIPMFGLLVGIAFFAGLHFANREVRRLLPEQPPEFMTNVGMIGFFGGIIGARLFHLLEHLAEFVEHPMEMLLSRGGFTIYGGLIIGLAAGLVYCRKKHAPLATMLDAVAPGIMLAYAVGRIGCQISGDGDWGIAADLAAKPGWIPQWLWAQTYDGNIAGVLIPPPGVYPTPIYETVMALICFAVLSRLRLHRHKSGWLFGVYLVLVGIERLLIEPIRVNTTFDLAGTAVTQAQIISVLCVAGGIAVMIWRRRSAQPATA